MNIEIIPWKDGMKPELGKCYSGMPNETYHGFIDWWGSSSLKHAQRSVESFHYELEQPHKITLPLERGSAFHVAMEGLATEGCWDMFDRLVKECSTKTILTKDWQSIKDANPDCYVLPALERENVDKMTSKLHGKMAPFGFFAEGWPELSFFWIDEETGFQLKCRPDWLRPGKNGWVDLDYKTSKNHQLEAFRKDVANLGYHFSAAMYCTGIEAVTGIPVEKFRWLVVADTAPFECACYLIGEFTRAEGLKQFRKSLTDIKNYTKSPLFDEPLEIPNWAFKET